MNPLPLLNPLTAVSIVADNRDLLRQIVVRNLSSKYRGSILGFAWSLIQPMIMLAVYTFVFGFLFKARWGADYFDDNKAAFPIILFCGMAVFNVFSESANTASRLILDNPSYVKKVVFPLELLPVCNVATSCVFSLAWFTLLLGGIWLFLDISWTVLFLPAMFLPLALLCMGTSFAVAAFGVYIRDTPHLVAAATQILFFMTPVFYPMAIVPEHLRWVIALNPLAVLVEQFRLVLIAGRLPSPASYIGICFVCALIFQLGFAWFRAVKKGFADVM